LLSFADFLVVCKLSVRWLVLSAEMVSLALLQNADRQGTQSGKGKSSQGKTSFCVDLLTHITTVLSVCASVSLLVDYTILNYLL